MTFRQRLVAVVLSMAMALILILLTASGFEFLTHPVFLAVPLILITFIVLRADPLTDVRRIGERIVKWFALLFTGSLLLLVGVGVPLFVIYFLVRFVKWAWTN
jgi:hypothetical protein